MTRPHSQCCTVYLLQLLGLYRHVGQIVFPVGFLHGSVDVVEGGIPGKLLGDFRGAAFRGAGAGGRRTGGAGKCWRKKRKNCWK